jgi:hypothetical protein
MLHWFEMDGHQDQSGVSARNLTKKLIFWDFPRASWPYDVVVGLILIFIFATPRTWFSDQPRAASVVLLSPERGHGQVYIEPDLLRKVPETARVQRAAELIHQRTGKRPKVVSVEPIRDDAERELKGFIAYTTP